MFILGSLEENGIGNVITYNAYMHTLPLCVVTCDSVHCLSSYIIYLTYGMEENV